MSRVLKERLKSIIIGILIMTGILQIGILWGYQDQGTPIGLFPGIFKHTNKVDSMETREKLFMPDKLILSDGSKSHWVLKRDDKYYNTLWDAVKQGLYKIASGKTSLRLSAEEWGTVAEKRGFLVDFGYAVSPELLAWFIGAGEKSPDITATRKVKMVPDIVNRDVCLVYFYNMDGRVYVSGPVNCEKAKGLETVLSAVSRGETGTYREYYTLRGGKIDKKEDEADVLYVSGYPRYWPYYEISTEIPAWTEEKEELATVILGTEKDRYNKSSNNNSVQFNYGDNVYRFYSNGYLTYRYLGTIASTGNKDVGEALLNAYKVVAGIADASQDSGADIVLTSVEEKTQGVFLFEFDYSVDGMPVKLEMSMKEGGGIRMSHAAIVEADSKRVLKFDWLLREFHQGSEKNYNDRFVDVLAMTDIAYKDIGIKDICPGYFIGSVDEWILAPRLLVDIKSGKMLHIEMPPELLPEAVPEVLPELPSGIPFEVPPEAE